MLSSKIVKPLVRRVAKWQDGGMGKKALVLGAVGLRCAQILQDAAIEAGVTNAKIAAEIEMSEATVSRVFNARRPLTIDELDAFADAVGLVGWQVLRSAEEALVADVIEFPAVSRRAAKNPGYSPDAEADQ